MENWEAFSFLRVRPNKLLIFGHYGIPNWGDEAILTGLLKALGKIRWQITVASPFKERVQKTHQVATVSPPPAGLRSLCAALFRGTLWSSLRAIQQADFILFGGGALFQENPPAALRIWSWYLRICLFFQKKVLLVANSIGPLHNEQRKKKTATLFQKVAFFSVRDRDSQKLLCTMGIPQSKIVVATDAAFFLTGLKKPEKRHGILFALRQNDLHTGEILELQKLIQNLTKKKQKSTFLPMQIPQAHDDLVAKKLKIPPISPENLNAVRQKIATAEIVIANRFHAVLFAILSGTPFLAIPSRPKLRNFLRTAGLSAYIFSGKITAKHLEQAVKRILKNKKSVQLDLQRALREQKKRTTFILPGFFA